VVSIFSFNPRGLVPSRRFLGRLFIIFGLVAGFYMLMIDYIMNDVND
jgi:hypothetical protein